jgi:uncharacterized repeat protein (TIGR01451 family)
MLRRLLLAAIPFVSIAAFASSDVSVSVDYRNNYLVDPGTTATFTAIVRNRGNELAKNLTLRMPLPPGSTLVNLRSGAWNCSGNDSEVMCTLPELVPTGFAENGSLVTATATLSSDPNGMFSTVVATVTSETPDDFPSNNQSGITTIIYRMLTVNSTADSGPGSLRDGIADANARCLSDVPCKMTLDLPALSTIEPLTPLPAITARTLRIDGDRTLTGDRRIELSGARLSAGNGLEIRSAGTPNNPSFFQIYGLAINRFPDYGVAIIGGGHASMYLDGLFVGTDVTGKLAQPNGRGIGIFAPNAYVNINNNVISGNVHSGVFAASTSTIWMYNCLIGVGSDGRALGNGNSGIFLFRGGVDVGSSTIGNNGQFGVSIDPAAARASLFNTRIFANGLQGIDWGLDGPSTGLSARRIPDAPVITDAIYDASKDETIITGTFDRASIVGALIYIDVFSSTARNAVGRAEGEQVLDRVAPSGLTFTARAKGDQRGRIITATLNVGPYLDAVPTLTSEFSEGVVAH